MSKLFIYQMFSNAFFKKLISSITYFIILILLISTIYYFRPEMFQGFLVHAVSPDSLKMIEMSSTGMTSSEPSYLSLMGSQEGENSLVGEFFEMVEATMINLSVTSDFSPTTSYQSLDSIQAEMAPSAEEFSEMVEMGMVDISAISVTSSEHIYYSITGSESMEGFEELPGRPLWQVCALSVLTGIFWGSMAVGFTSVAWAAGVLDKCY